MDKRKALNISSSIVNYLNFGLSFWAILYFFLPYFPHGALAGGVYCFRYFTNLSNILCGLGCLIIGIYKTIILIKPEVKIPRWAVCVKFSGVIATSVTMLTVLCFLGPTMGFEIMYTNNNLLLHLICPLLGVLSMVFLEPESNINKKESLSGALPTLIYGTVYAILVLGTNYWPDFYQFNSGGFWYLVFPIMLLLSMGYSLLASYLGNLVHRLYFKKSPGID